MKKFNFVFVLIVLNIITVTNGFSWSKKTGHRYVAIIAENFLSDKAKAKLEAINVKTLDDYSIFARPDDIRDCAHYVNMPDTGKYSQTLYCADSNCVVEKLNSYIIKMQLSPSKDNLMYIVHLLADLHCPMHISRAEDKGGNLIQISVGGKDTKLHSYWDGFLFPKGDIEKKYIDDLMQIAKENVNSDAANNLNLVSIANATHSFAIKAYKEADDGVIDQKEISNDAAIAQSQIVLAGLRLAKILNIILK